MESTGLISNTIFINKIYDKIVILEIHIKIIINIWSLWGFDFVLVHFLHGLSRKERKKSKEN